MKKLIACFTITTFIFSCQTTKSTTAEKQPETKEATQENTIIGKWRLIKTSGGFTGRTQNQSPNQVEILEFTSTEMIHISNGKETSRVKYTLGKGKSIHSTNQVPMIFRDNIYALPCIIGGILYVYLQSVISHNFALFISVIFIVLIRIISEQRKLNLPRIEY